MYRREGIWLQMFFDKIRYRQHERCINGGKFILLDFIVADGYDSYDLLAEEKLIEKGLYVIPINIAQFLTQNDFAVRRMPLPQNTRGMLLADKHNKILDTNSNKLVLVSNDLDFKEYRFVAAHEYSHYIQDENKNGQYDHSTLIVNEKLTEDKKVAEQKANTLALCLLMPKKLLLDAWNKLDSNLYIEKKLEELARVFEVELFHLMVRLGMMGLIEYGK